jgi:ankyrin repeat protein
MTSGEATMHDELFGAIKTGDLAALKRILDTDPSAARAVDENGISALLTAVYHQKPEAVAALRAVGIDLNVFEAAAVGDSARVRELLTASPALARSYSSDGFHPLGLAAFFKQFDVLKILLGFGADVHAPSRNAMKVTALHSAVADGGHRDSALALIAGGADPNAKQRHGWTPLHGAAESGDRAVVDALLAAGADPTLANDDGRTAADVAREAGHAEIAKALG